MWNSYIDLDNDKIKYEADCMRHSVLASVFNIVDKQRGTHNTSS